MPAQSARQFISYAYQQLPNRKPGLRVYLTVDQNLQRAAETSVSEELARFDRGPYGFYNQLSYSHAIKQGRKVTRRRVETPSGARRARRKNRRDLGDGRRQRKV